MVGIPIMAVAVMEAAMAVVVDIRVRVVMAGIIAEGA